ncbi:hypothetical protein ACOME3_007775 [Neoechinorhynchus agilis]
MSVHDEDLEKTPVKPGLFRSTLESILHSIFTFISEPSVPYTYMANIAQRLSPPVYGQPLQLTSQPTNIRCPYCGSDVCTLTASDSGALTWLLSIAICCLGCFCGCCMIPFVVDDTKDVIHSCPNCKKHLGVYRRLF